MALNIENILKLADTIEQAKDYQFSMYRFQHACGAPACFAGWGDYLNRPNTTIDYADTTDSVNAIEKSATAYLGLTEDQAEALFVPDRASFPHMNRDDYYEFSMDHSPWNISNTQGAKILRHLAATGEVDFAVAYKD